MKSEIMEAENDIIESFNNCWRGLCRKYHDNPDDSLRNSINFLSKIIGKVEAEVLNRRKQADKQISIDEWLEWFKSEAEK